MDSIEKFVSIIEDNIVGINNKISQIRLASSLDSVLSLLDESKIWDLTSDDVSKLENNLVDDLKLTEEELGFLNVFVDMPDVIKSFKRNSIGIGDDQKKVIEQIKNKLGNSKINYSNMDVGVLEQAVIKYKTLLNKLNQNDLNLITEIDLIVDIIKNAGFSLSEQLIVFKYINNINMDVYSNYNLSLGDSSVEEDVELSEDDLEIVDLDPSLLDYLFEEFDINWDINNKHNLSDRAKKFEEAKLLECREKLLKYGDYENMKLLLTFVRDNDLTFVLEMPEILTKMLLFTKLEKLEQLKDISVINGIDYHDILRKFPTIFFPALRENKVRGMNLGDGKDKKTLTGSLDNYLKNIEFLNNHNYSAQQVFEDCPSLSRFSTRTIKKVHDRLQLYGISFTYPDGSLKKGFSVLGTLDVLDKLDVGIECGCYEYYENNISKFVDSSLNMYRIKLARSQGEVNIFKTYSSKNNHKGIYLPSKYTSKIDNHYGKTPHETFRMYGAIYYDSDFRETYDSIVNNSDNDVISNISLKDNLIEQLDALYKSPDNDYIYDFDGVIISRFKVLRFYQTLMSSSGIVPCKDALLYSIMKFSMLNVREYDKVMECIDQIKFKERTLS